MYKIKKEKLKELKDFLKEKKIDDVKKSLDDLEVIEKAINKRDKFKNMLLYIIVGFISLMIISFGFTFKINKANLKIKLKTKGLEIVLKDSIYIRSSESLSLKKFLIQGDFKKIEGGGIVKTPDVSEINTIVIEGSNIGISEFLITSSSVITLNDEKHLSFFVRNTQVKGIANSFNQILKLETSQEEIIDSTDGAIVFETQYVDENHQIRVDLDSCQLFENINTSKINLTKETPPSSGKFESLILSGEVQVLETKTSYQLSKGDFLVLDSLLEGAKLDVINKGDNTFEIMLTCKISQAKILSDSKEYVKNIIPNYLEYYSYNEQVAFIWGLFLSLFGIIWSLKNIIFNK